MNRQQIKIMMHESGLIDWFNSENDEYIDFANCIDKFAALVAAHEREACAQVCDVLAVHPEYASDITKVAAQAIRSRGEQ